jgi:hypothetical protein
MGALVGVLLGLLVGTYGFLVMRNPMRLALLPWQKSYYQRMVLDTTMRNQLRVLGVLVCLMGTSILAGAESEFLDFRIGRTLGSHGVDFFCGLGSGTDSRNSATHQGRAI